MKNKTTELRTEAETVSGDGQGHVLPPIEEGSSEERIAPAIFDRANATAIDPARVHKPTGKTVAWEQEGFYYNFVGTPIGPVDPDALGAADKPMGKEKYSGQKPAKRPSI